MAVAVCRRNANPRESTRPVGTGPGVTEAATMGDRSVHCQYAQRPAHWMTPERKRNQAMWERKNGLLQRGACATSSEPRSTPTVPGQHQRPGAASRQPRRPRGHLGQLEPQLPLSRHGRRPSSSQGLHPTLGSFSRQPGPNGPCPGCDDRGDAQLPERAAGSPHQNVAVHDTTVSRMGARVRALSLPSVADAQANSLLRAQVAARKKPRWSHSR